MRYTSRLARYARWEALDFAIERGIALFFFAAAVLMPAFVARSIDAGPPFATMSVYQVYWLLGREMGSLFALVVVSAMVSNDRHAGNYRLLFAKPVSIPAFYAQRFVVWGIGLVIVDGVVAGAIAATLGPLNPVSLIAYHLLIYALVGGVCFFFSTLMRADWVGVLVVYVPTFLLLQMWPEPARWQRAVIAVFPPVRALGRVGEALRESMSVSLTDVLMVVGYGAAFFLAGLLVLERREITR